MPSTPFSISDRLQQSGTPRIGQIDLRHVSRDHGLGVIAEPRQEHLHLLAGGVLRLVHDDERVIQRAAAHESERRYFNHILSIILSTRSWSSRS